MNVFGDIGRANSTIFTTLDLTSGFWQMPLHPDDAHLHHLQFRAEDNSNGLLVQWDY